MEIAYAIYNSSASTRVFLLLSRDLCTVGSTRCSFSSVGYFSLSTVAARGSLLHCLIFYSGVFSLSTCCSLSPTPCPLECVRTRADEASHDVLLFVGKVSALPISSAPLLLAAVGLSRGGAAIFFSAARAVRVAGDRRAVR